MLACQLISKSSSNDASRNCNANNSNSNSVSLKCSVRQWNYSRRQQKLKLRKQTPKQTKNQSVITDAQCSNGVCVPKAAPELVALPAKTPAQICRDRGFNWYGYCADTKAEQ